MFHRPNEKKVLLILTLIIGAVVGLAVVAFIVLTENLGARMYPAGGAPWRRLLTPLVGALATGYLLSRSFPNARGSGIPQTKVALFLRDGYISLRTVIGKFGLCSVSLASGIALGREGPSVQVGAGLASVLGRRLGLSANSVKALVPAGASAALAAAFNTPISAVLFSLEEVMGDMQAPVLGLIVLSSATSWMVLHLLLGDEPLFHVPAYQLVNPLEFIFYAALGVAGGLVSVAFVKVLLWQRKRFLAMPASMQWFLPGVGGLTVGLLGWFYPQVLGVGYGYVGQALNGQLLMGTMALLVFLKLIATATCYSSGNAGGIFGPSLFIGAMMGGAVGEAAHLLMPDYTGSAGAYALVGMGAAFAGIIRTPMTSVIMIFEITRDYSIIVPLMIANLISYYLSSKLQEEPIYEALQRQDGIHLPAGSKAREVQLTVGDGLRRDLPVVTASETVRQAEMLVERAGGIAPVVDQGGLRGMISSAQLKDAVRSGRGAAAVAELVPPPVPADLLTAESFPHLHSDHSLEEAMQRIAASGWEVVPVVSRQNTRELEGTISVSDILAAYAPKPAATESDETVYPAATGWISRMPLVKALTALAMIVFLAGTLNYFFRTARKGQADTYFRTGIRLAAQQRYDEAVEQYRKALSITPNAERRLALGVALLNAGAWSESTTYLKEVLREQPQNGAANLGMARVLVHQGRINDAAESYRRAANGFWADNPRQHRAEARLEMADVLARAGRRTESAGELLSLAAQSQDNPAVQERAGRALLDLGMPQEASDLFTDMAQRNRQSAAAYSGLGEARFQAADYGGAQTAFRAALRINPGDQQAASRLSACEMILALDPTVRGLRPAERLRRSRTLLVQGLDDFSRCAARDNGLPPRAKSATEAARAAITHPRRRNSEQEAEQANLALAEQLWSERLRMCGSKPPDTPLTRVMGKLATQ